MNLTTIERVRSLLTGKANGGTPRDSEDTANDTALEAVIVAVSGAVERYLQRSMVTQSRTEYFTVAPWDEAVRLKAYPVTTLTGAWYDPDQGFGSDTALDDNDYFDPTLDDSGVFAFKAPFLPISTARNALKVTYTGGMAADTDAFVAAYPDLAGAVDQQVAHEWQRRSGLGVSSVNYPDGTNASFTFDRWLKSTQQVLDSYKRESVG